MATAKKSNEEVVVRGTEAVVPAWMEEEDLAGLVDSNLGLEEIKAGDMTMPRLALCQKMSKQLEENDKLYIPNLKSGDWFNTLTGEIYGKGPLYITPLFARRSRRLFAAQELGGQTLCVSHNGETGGRISPKSCEICPKSQFGYDKEKGKSTKPECTLFWTYIVILHLEGRKFTPIALSMKSTQLKVASKFNTYMRMRGKAAFTGVYTLETIPDSANNIAFWNAKIDNAGYLTAREQFEDAKTLFENLRGKIDKIEVHGEDVLESEVVDEDEAVPF